MRRFFSEMDSRPWQLFDTEELNEQTSGIRRIVRRPRTDFLTAGVTSPPPPPSYQHLESPNGMDDDLQEIDEEAQFRGRLQAAVQRRVEHPSSPSSFTCSGSLSTAVTTSSQHQASSPSSMLYDTYNLNSMMRIDCSDGGEMSSEYAMKNVLLPTQDVYCSIKPRNVNLVFYMESKPQVRQQQQASAQQQQAQPQAATSTAPDPLAPFSTFTRMRALASAQQQDVGRLHQSVQQSQDPSETPSQRINRLQTILSELRFLQTAARDRIEAGNSANRVPVFPRASSPSSRRDSADRDRSQRNDTVMRSTTNPEDAKPFCVSQLLIKQCSSGFTHPLQAGILFVSQNRPDVEQSSRYDLKRGMSLDSYRQLHGFDKNGYALPRRQEQGTLPNDNDDSYPVFMFEIGANENSRVFDLPYPIHAKWLHVKLLCGHNTQLGDENIDVCYIGFRGYIGSFVSSDSTLLQDPSFRRMCVLLEWALRRFFLSVARGNEPPVGAAAISTEAKFCSLNDCEVTSITEIVRRQCILGVLLFVSNTACKAWQSVLCGWQ